MSVRMPGKGEDGVDASEKMWIILWKLLKYENCIMVTKRDKKLHPWRQGRRRVETESIVIISISENNFICRS